MKVTMKEDNNELTFITSVMQSACFRH